jgi:3-oxoacyl-[acyl-carrier-protein] synthase-3
VAATTFGSDPSGCDEVAIPRTGHFRQNGPAVHKFAIKKMASLLGEVQQMLDPARRERLFYVGHQANLTMLEAVCRRQEIPPERHLFNIVRFGNQSSAGAPAVLSQRWDDLRSGDVAALVVVGSGLSWSSLTIEVG